MESRNPALRRQVSLSKGGYATFDQPTPSAEELERRYGTPSASPVQTGRMTIDDVVTRTGAMFGVLLIAAAVGWFVVPGLWLPAMLVGLVLGLVNSFKREPSPALILAYAAVEGLFLGGISSLFETAYNGVVVQAVLATMATFGAMLFLYRSGRIRVTPRFQKIMLIAVAGYAVFCLLNLGLALFTDVSVRGGFLGLAIGAVGATLAALSLVLDFDFIEKGIKQGIPAKYAWSAAFGLVVTLIWLYIEFLRILSILRGDD